MHFKGTTPIIAAFLAAGLPSLAVAEPATATAALVGGLSGFFIKRSQGPSTNVGLSVHGYVPTPVGSDASACREILARHRVESGKQVVAQQDHVAVALKHVVLGSDLSFPIQIPDLLSNRIQVAVVANAYEMCTDSNCPSGFNFRPDADQEGRVVYFSNDVRWDQTTLSFGALPMFGPFPYQGNPVGFSLHVVKLANDQSANLGPMLTTLANLGKQSSAALGSEVGAVLNSIGSNLLKGFDVRLLRYDTMLYSAGFADDQSLGISKFYYGDYIVVRKEDRTQEVDFSKFRYNPQNGHLYSDSQCTAGSEVRDLTYGVIQVLKASQAANGKPQLLKELRTGLAELASADGANLTAGAVQTVYKTASFKADLDLVRRSRGFRKAGDFEGQEGFLAVIQRVKSSTSSDGKTAQGAPYTVEQLDQIKNAARVLYGIDWTKTDQEIFDKAKAAWAPATP